MSTQEWISSDNEIWMYDYRDDFIWLPDTFTDGLTIFVCQSETFQYVADKQVFQYTANRSK